MSKLSMAKIRKLALVLETLLVFVVLDLILSRWSFETVHRRVVSRSRPTALPDGEDDRREIVTRIAEAVAVATRCYYRRRKDCLPRSLVLCRLLRRRGLRAELCLGVRQYPFSAHAWVECEGELVDDSPQRVGRYRLLTRLGTPARP